MSNLVRIVLILVFAWVFYEGVSGLVGDAGGINKRRIGLAIGAIALGAGFVVLRQKGHEKRHEMKRMRNDQKR